MNLLIVDDHPSNRKLLRVTLEAEGHTTLEAADGVEALQILSREKVDVVISDILMPRMDGNRLCHEVRKDARFAHLPFIVYTATFTTPSDERISLDLGADAFIRKPASVGVITAALKEVTAKGRPPRARAKAPVDELELLKVYSERLVAKLEEQNIELEQANAELSATRGQLAHLLEHSPAVIYSHKVDGDRVIPSQVSENITRLLGFTVEEACGFDWWAAHLHPEDRERQFARIPEIIKGGFPNVEYRVQHKDGHYVWVEDSHRLVRDAEGKPTDIVGVWADITERKRAEEGLKQRAAELERFHSLSVGRELKMVELKQQVNELSERSGKPAPFELSFLPKPAGVAQ